MEMQYFNRELSWIEFNARVLAQALKTELPLFERLQFLAIVSSNFDEFFQVRVASTKRALRNGNKADVDGITPGPLLTRISDRAHEIVNQQNQCLIKDLLPELKNNGFAYIAPENYTESHNDFLRSYFKHEIYPLLTPLRTDQEFPHITGLEGYAAFLLKPIAGFKDANQDFRGDDEKPRIAFVQVPSVLSHVILLPKNKPSDIQEFALLGDVVCAYGRDLFPGFDVEESLKFKLIRDADFAVDEDPKNNFISEMEKVLVQRKLSFPVALFCTKSSETLKNFLIENLGLGDQDIYETESIIDPGILTPLRNFSEDETLSFKKWEHFYPHNLPEDEPFWDILKREDILLHVPYHSYNPVVKFISDAADDPDVLAIKMTLYRTGKNSPIITALERAAQNGKQVTVLVELKARFDEERNIEWAHRLENAGATVVYGLVNLKVHAKILMVMRREDDSIRRYVHLATGNYNTKTAKLYSDISLFTANTDIASDATKFFNLVTGYSTMQKMDHLGMAPVTLKSRLLSMIDREIDRCRHGESAMIMAKMNSLTHTEMIDALYKASQAGVKVLLNIRGICMLVPGVKGLSENIRVVSIVDRFLEHSRIFYFQNGDTPEIYCSSADWMARNLDRRIELMFPIWGRETFKEVKEILETYFEDDCSAMELCETGEWKPVKKGRKSINAQEALYKKYRKLSETTAEKNRSLFIVRRSK